ncbi:sperm acrosome membrane-associated protein 4 [Kryptolebias marmoratus]|uniref:Lymphocyte antigen-6, epidermis n=1 Tax=Kryptolebias marmoratus TaxID=37003 RepID=A0A3Q3ALA0_KRYMA|nr:sperm acrosome membrane-associated protein 4 [Kryptolebias marmoratus]
MKRVIFMFAVAVCFAAGQALMCYKCEFGFGDLCLTTNTTCKTGEYCYSGEGKAAGFISIKMKGCLAMAECNKTENVNFPTSGSNTTVYKMTKTCCNMDLCNAAPGLPGASALSLALAAVSALFVANLMV